MMLKRLVILGRWFHRAGCAGHAAIDVVKARCCKEAAGWSGEAADRGRLESVRGLNSGGGLGQ